LGENGGGVWNETRARKEIDDRNNWVLKKRKSGEEGQASLSVIPFRGGWMGE